MKKALKRSLSFLLAITIIFSSAYVGLSEVDFDSLFAFRAKAASLSDLTFELNDDGKSYSFIGLNAYATGKVSIPATYKNLPVTSIADGAFFCSDVSEVEIPNTVTRIGEEAFYLCEKLHTIRIPSSVTTIGDIAFWECNNLANVYITDLSAWCNIDFEGWRSTNPLFYADNLYLNDKLVVDLIIPNNIKELKPASFYGYTSLRSVFIHGSVKKIGDSCFAGCSHLMLVVLSDGILNVGKGAFSECRNIVSIKIPDSVTSIGPGSFYGCSRLSSVSIPNSVLDIKSNTFSNCDSLKYINLPDGLTEISSSLFRNSDNLEKVVMGADIVSIGDRAFENCGNLKKVCFKGTREQWDKIKLEDNNSMIKFNYSSICCNYIPPANNDINYGNYEDGFSLSNYMLEYYSISDTFGKQKYDEYINTFNNFSGSQILINSAEGSSMEAGIDAWYAIKCVANPGYALNALNYKQQYEMLVYGVLFDTLYDEKLNTITYNNAITKSAAFTSDLVDKWNLADILDKTNLTGAESQQVKEAALEFIGKSDTKWTALGEYTGLLSKVSGSIDKIVKSGVSGYNMAQKVAMLSQLMEMGDEAISYLYLLQDNATDRHLKSAIQSVIDSVSNGWVGIVEKVVLDAQFTFSKKLVEKLIDNAWDLVCKANPFLSGMAIGDVVGTFVCNALFSTEDMIEQYSHMKKIVELKNTIFKTQQSLYDECKKYTNSKNTMTWIFSLYFMNTLHEIDFAASTEFARITLKSGLINCVKNTFSSYQEQQYDEYKKSADSIIKVHKKDFEYLMSNEVIKRKLCEVYPEYYSSCYPTPESDFTYKIVNNTVTITSVKNGRCDIVIPDEIEGKPVTTLAEDMLRGFDFIDIVVVGKHVKDVPGITTLYYNASRNLNDLRYVYVDVDNPYYCSLDGVMFSKDKKILYKYGCMERESYEIPNGVTKINNTAFYGCDSLTSITIPKTVTSIDEYSFGKCLSLKEVYYGGTLAQRQNINIGVNNDELINANWHYPTIPKPATPKVKAVNTIKGMNVTWNAVDGAVKYALYKRLGTANSWTYVTTTTGTSYADNNAPSAGSYYVYTVKAYNSAGTSSEYIKSNCASVQRVIAPYTKAANAANGINVTWGKVAGANKYVVLRRIGTENTWKTIGETTGTSFLDKNVKAGIYYIYSIRAVNNTGYSAYDINKRITIMRILTPVVTATNLANGVQIKWNAVTGAKKYNVYRRPGGTSTFTYVGTTTGTSFVDKNVKNGTYYIYSVRAYNGASYSAYIYGNTDTIQPITAPTAKAVNKSTGVQLSWNSVTGATKYNVYRRLGGTSNWIYVGTTTGTSLLDKSVVDGKTYAYSIRAINGTGYSAYNSSKCVAIKHT